MDKQEAGEVNLSFPSFGVTRAVLLLDKNATVSYMQGRRRRSVRDVHGRPGRRTVIGVKL